jgi:hypothetical protein
VYSNPEIIYTDSGTRFWFRPEILLLSWDCSSYVELNGFISSKRLISSRFGSVPIRQLASNLNYVWAESSVADPGFIPDPDFHPFRIPDLGSRIQVTKERGGKIFFIKPFFGATTFTKLLIILILKC